MGTNARLSRPLVLFGMAGAGLLLLFILAVFSNPFSASASHAGSPDTVHSCVDTDSGDVGIVKPGDACKDDENLVTSDVVYACAAEDGGVLLVEPNYDCTENKGTAKIRWSIQGPQGLQGSEGLPGPQGLLGLTGLPGE